jgi:hypothetical protein
MRIPFHLDPRPPPLKSRVGNWRQGNLPNPCGADKGICDKSGEGGFLKKNKYSLTYKLVCYTIYIVLVLSFVLLFWIGGGL